MCAVHCVYVHFFHLLSSFSSCLSSFLFSCRAFFSLLVFSLLVSRSSLLLSLIFSLLSSLPLSLICSLLSFLLVVVVVVLLVVVVCVCVWCVCGVCVCVCVCCGTQKKNVEKPVCGFKNASVCTFKNVPVCTGTTRICVSTCARGAGKHGDVLTYNTGTF